MGMLEDMDQVSMAYKEGAFDDSFSPYLRMLAEQGKVGNKALQSTLAEMIPEGTAEALNNRFPLFGLTEQPRQAISNKMDEAGQAIDEATGGWASALGNSLELGATLYNPTSVLANAKRTAHKGSANIPNDLPGFYVQKAEAEARAANRLGGKLYEKAPNAAMKFEQALGQFQATAQGLAKGLSNALNQSFTPKGRALWEQKGVSKTLEDIALDPKGDSRMKGADAWGPEIGGRKSEAIWGQPAYERILSSQYGKKNPILSQLDDEYFTHEGVFNYDDFKKASGHVDDDEAGAFFRTIAANNKIKSKDEYIMLVRKPTQNQEDSGSLLTDILYSPRNQYVPKIAKAFNPAQGFNSGESFLRFFDKDRKSMPEERRTIIRKAYRDNPELAGITDKAQLKKQLTVAVAKAAKARGEKPFGVGNYVDVAMKRRGVGAFESNDELAEALKAQGLNIIRNSKQGKDRDVYIAGSTHSSAYELGGISLVYKVEKDGTIKGQMSDVNDLVGVGAPLGMPLITVSPVVTRKLGQMNDKAKGAKKPSAHARSDVYLDVLEPYSPTKADYAKAGARQTSAAVPIAGAAGEYQDERVKGMLLD